MSLVKISGSILTLTRNLRPLSNSISTFGSDTALVGFVVG